MSNPKPLKNFGNKGNSEPVKNFGNKGNTTKRNPGNLKNTARPADKLSDAEEAFAQEYMIDKNKSRAAARAGFSTKTSGAGGCRIFAKPRVKARILELMEEQAERTRIDADWVLKSAVDVYDRCMQNMPVYDKNGEPVTCETKAGNLAAAYKFDAAGANKALDTIGKHVDVQAFLVKTENKHTLSDDFDSLLDSIDDEQ